MAYNELKENVDELHEETKEYVERSLQYYKLWSFKVMMQSTTMVVKVMLIALSALMLLLFVSIAGALALGNLFDSNSIGFLLVAGFYLILFIAFLFIKPQIIEGSVLKRFSEIFFSE